MANRLIAPSLADVSQDIAGVIPVDVILRWATGRKTAANHRLLLEPFVVKGTVASSDSAGLSKLTKFRSLLEVMKLVNQPKEIVFAYGSAIGGKAIGVWAADNTQMFYDEGVDPESVVEQMIGAQSEIKNLEVQIGIGIHKGEFIHIGDGLFGRQADLIEDLTENETAGGEILMTNKLLGKAAKKWGQYLVKRDLRPRCYSLDYGKLRVKPVKTKKFSYPYPFTHDFFRFIRADGIDDRRPEYLKYSQVKIVVLVKIVHKQRRLLLDQLADWVLANAILKKITVLDGISEIKSNGSLGIFITDSVQQAIEFAVDLKDTMGANGFVANVGISKGEVLVFPLGKNKFEIAGGAVNIASKLAEDSGAAGEILVEDSVKLSGTKTPKLKEFAIKLSAVELRGVKLLT